MFAQPIREHYSNVSFHNIGEKIEKQQAIKKEVYTEDEQLT
jgi:hypothetical protein